MTLIKCEIKTPQFKDGKIYRYHRQSGIFNTDTLLFSPNLGMFGQWCNGDHPVQFGNIKQFNGCRIHIPKKLSLIKRIFA
jgi:hypothetical protein